MKNVLLATTFASLLSVSSFDVSAEIAPVSFQDIPEVMTEFDTAKEFRKKALTYGRLPHRSEIDRVFPTYVADDNGKPKLETENVVSADVVIARNPEPVSGAVFNEWLVPKEKWEDTYGELPQFVEFAPFKRVKTIKAIPITDEVLTLLGSEDGETAVIAVEWNDQGMTVYKDGYLADGGYGIAPEEMAKTYEEVEP
ncbi:hypothetical protein MD588_22515 [Photobacterium sp. SDRW27]|uniref:hypothetical protein n=1 Tax=Photobacterium obscurum TaxID=2829490 RepID=UPI0022449B34|nr:hypothetical protein [Photobacterium obscurum]MCW8331575.1 hypothetical protein [Photobacterium obscurum]